MSELGERVAELLAQGYHCSQTMMKLSMEMRGIEDPFVLRSLGALGGGMFCQRTCGTLTGGVAVLSSYCPRQQGEAEPVMYQAMAKELVGWFEAGEGSIDCRDLVEFDRQKIMAFCPGLMERTFEKCLDILEANGIDPAEYTESQL